MNSLMNGMEDYNPELYGFEWAEDEAPRFQLVPMGIEVILRQDQ